MDREHARQMIDVLEQARRRPGMYFPLNESGIGGFLGGLHALRVSGWGPPDPSIRNDPGITIALLRERGWESHNAVALQAEMEARGLDIHTMITEVLTIEIETLRRQYNL